jgi:hypothetical protein
MNLVLLGHLPYMIRKLHMQLPPVPVLHPWA